MRGDEVLALRAGCCRRDTTADGLIYVYRLQSTLSKGQPKPTTASWVVTEHVHRAVEVLEQLPRLPNRSDARASEAPRTPLFHRYIHSFYTSVSWSHTPIRCWRAARKAERQSFLRDVNVAWRVPAATRRLNHLLGHAFRGP